MSRPSCKLVIGIIHPRGEPDGKNTHMLTESQLRQKAQRLRGLPILDEHTSLDEVVAGGAQIRERLGERRVGQVLRARVTADHALQVLFQLNADERGDRVFERIRSGEWRGLSIGTKNYQLGGEGGPVVRKDILECTVVDEGALPGTVIQSWMDTGDVDIESLQRTHMRGDDAATDNPKPHESSDGFRGALDFLRNLEPFTSETSPIQVVTAAKMSANTPQQADAKLAPAPADSIEAKMAQMQQQMAQMFAQNQALVQTLNAQQAQHAQTPQAQAMAAMAQVQRGGLMQADAMSEAHRQALAAERQYQGSLEPVRPAEILGAVANIVHEKNQTRDLEEAMRARNAEAAELSRRRQELMPMMAEQSVAGVSAIQQQQQRMYDEQQAKFAAIEQQQLRQMQLLEQQNAQQTKMFEAMMARQAAPQQPVAAHADMDTSSTTAAAAAEQRDPGKRGRDADSSSSGAEERIRAEERKAMAAQLRAQFEQMPDSMKSGLSKEDFEMWTKTVPGALERGDVPALAMQVSANARATGNTLRDLDMRLKDATIAQLRADTEAMAAQRRRLEGGMGQSASSSSSQGPTIATPVGYIDPASEMARVLKSTELFYGPAINPYTTVGEPVGPGADADMYGDVGETWGDHRHSLLAALQQWKAETPADAAQVDDYTHALQKAMPLVPAACDPNMDPHLRRATLSYMHAHPGYSLGFGSAKPMAMTTYDLNDDTQYRKALETW